MLLYTNIEQTLVNSLHRLLNSEIGGSDCHVITTEYTCPLYTHVIYSGVSGQCSHTIQGSKYQSRLPVIYKIYIKKQK